MNAKEVCKSFSENLKFEVEEDDWKLESELIETPWWTRKPTIKDKLGHGKIKDMIK